MTRTREAVKQVAVADRLLLTKTDIAGEAVQTRLLARLAMLNPTAVVIHSREGDAPASALTGAGSSMRPLPRPDEIVGWFERAARATERSRFRAEACHESCRDPDCADPRHGLRHDKGISTFSSYVIDRSGRLGRIQRSGSNTSRC